MPSWPNLADDLPAPRDDEPSSLRQDIADELADHLSSAFNRELHLTRDETTAKEKVLDRFGDPRKIARKLWLDAMQEKLMSQRMTFVALLVVLLASLGSMGLTWFLIDQSRQINQTMLEQSREANAALLQQSQQLLSQSHDSNRALVEQGQKANEALLSKLGQRSTGSSLAAGSGKSLEWNPVKIRLYTDEKPGRPAVGYEVTLTGHILDTAKAVSITHKTDAQGIADMGLVRPGQHQLGISTPWQEKRTAATITVLPGQSLTEAIVCPGSGFLNTSIDFTVDWPDDLKNKGLWVVCDFRQEFRSFDDKIPWYTQYGNEQHVVLIEPEGRCVPFSMSNRSRDSALGAGQWWPFSPRGRQRAMTGLGTASVLQRNAPLELNFIIHDILPESAVQWPALTHRLQNILVTRPPRPLSDTDRRTGASDQNDTGPNNLDTEFDDLKKLVVVGGFIVELNLDFQMSQLGQRSSRHRQALAPLNGWVPQVDQRTGVDTSAKIREVQPTLIAKPDEPNHWRIPIPERLAELVRENLIAQSDDENKSAVPGANARPPAKSE